MMTVKVTGLKELEKALMELPKEVAQRPLRAAVNAGAKVVMDEAKNRAPQGETGNLRKAIYRTRTRRGSGTGKETYVVGVRKGKMKYADTANNRRLKRVGKTYQTRGLAYYWRFLEFGTSKLSARPFLRPAFEAKKDAAVDAIKAKLAEAIEKTAAKLRK